MKNALKKYILTLVVVYNIVFMWGIFGPTEIFFANYTELGILYQDFGRVFVMCGSVIALVLAFIISLFPRVIYKGVLALVSGIATAAYIQNMFLNRGLDQIGATALGYEPSMGKIVGNVIIWGIIIVVAFVCAYHRKIREQKIFGILAAFLLTVQLIGFGSLFLTTDKAAFEYPQSELCLSMEEQFTFSKNENIIILLFDNVSNVWLDDAREVYPDILDSVKDFTYFKNADCNYYGTFPSIVHTLTGNPLNTELTVNEYMKECWDNPYTNSFYNLLEEKNYKANAFLYQKEIIVAGNSLDITKGKLANVVETETRREVDYPLLYQTLLEMSCYRYAPDGLKQEFNVTSEQYARIIHYPDNTMAYANPDFYKALLEEGITLNEEKNYFVFNHLSGCHEFINDEKCERLSNADRDQAVRGLFTLVEEYLNQLKAVGIYDSSTIIIMTDHGVYFNAQPMFLVKRKNEIHDVVQESNAPITYDEIIPTLVEELGGDPNNFGISMYDIAENEARERIFFERGMNYDLPMVKSYDGVKAGEANVWKKYIYIGDRRNIEEVYVGEDYEELLMIDSYY